LKLRGGWSGTFHALERVIKEFESSAAKTLTETVAENRPPSNFLAETLRVSIQLPANNTEPAAVRAQVSSPRAIWLATIRHHLMQNAGIICQHRWRSIEPAGDANGR
jgi:hypothetical protein